MKWVLGTAFSLLLCAQLAAFAQNQDGRSSVQPPLTQSSKTAGPAAGIQIDNEDGITLTSSGALAVPAVPGGSVSTGPAAGRQLPPAEPTEDGKMPPPAVEAAP